MTKHLKLTPAYQARYKTFPRNPLAGAYEILHVGWLLAACAPDNVAAGKKLQAKLSDADAEQAELYRDKCLSVYVRAQQEDKNMTKWTQVAPLKTSKAKAQAALEYCINEEDRKDYRVVRSTLYPSRWEIQYGGSVTRPLVASSGRGPRYREYRSR